MPRTTHSSRYVRRLAAATFAFFAIVAAVSCGAYVALSSDRFRIDVWIAIHFAGAACSWAAARSLRRLDLVDTLVVSVCSFAIPLFGSPLAWAFVALNADAGAKNAHAQFEDEDPQPENYQRTGMTGEFEVDLARQISAISYAQILRQGTLQRRRNLLRSLARIGTPQHVAIIRRCLYDAEPELRLCAHGELDRLARKHEERIAEQRERLDPQNDDGLPSAPGSVSRACREYAKSGIFDEEMSEFWMMQAERYASKARERAPNDPTWVRLHAEILVEVGQFEAATDVLDSMESENEDLATALIRAEIAFAARDYDTIREVADEFESEFVPVPDWLAAIIGKRAAPAPAVGGVS